MNDPPRILDGAADADVEQLLHAARRTRTLDPAVSARSAARLVTAMGGTASPIAALTWTKVLLASVALGAVGVGVQAAIYSRLATQRHAEHVSTPSNVGRSRGALSDAPRRALGVPPIASAVRETSPSRVPRPADAPMRTSPAIVARSTEWTETNTTDTPASAQDQDPLEAEQASLDRIRALLRVDPHAAWMALEAHAQAFPRGELGAERQLLHYDALRALGRSDEARREGEAFLAQFGESPYAERVRREVSVRLP